MKMQTRKGQRHSSRSRSVGLTELPNDVLSLLVSKLAVQDTRSLVAATCACKAIQRLASRDSSVWKQAFYGVAEPPQETAETRRFEEAIAWFGGLRRLVTGRWEKRRAESLGIAKEELDSNQVYPYYMMFLILVRSPSLNRDSCLWAWGANAMYRPDMRRQAEESGGGSCESFGCPRIDHVPPFTLQALPAEAEIEKACVEMVGVSGVPKESSESPIHDWMEAAKKITVEMYDFSGRWPFYLQTRDVASQEFLDCYVCARRAEVQGSLYYKGL